MDKIYELRDVGFYYKTQGAAATPWVFQNVSFSINKGERWAIIGPSGCGKSTLLHMLAGLKPPSSGNLFFHGTSLIKPQPQIQLVFQEYGLFPWKTVTQNLALPLKLQGLEQSEIKRRTNAILNILGMSHLSKHLPNALSGGQQQRVAFGRAMISQPEVILMDEPFSALDTVTRLTLHHFVQEETERLGITSVLVTHQIEEAVEMADHILVFSKKSRAPLVRVLREEERCAPNAVVNELMEHFKEEGQ